MFLFLGILVSWKNPMEGGLWVFRRASRLGMLVCSVLTFHVTKVGCSGVLEEVWGRHGGGCCGVVMMMCRVRVYRFEGRM